MRYQYTSPRSYDLFSWGRPRPTIIRSLIIINLAIWGLVTLTDTSRLFFPLFGLVPRLVWSRFMIWQPFTYMFLHAGFWHVALNMLVLWMFGSELEREWGRTSFLRYYFVTGVGAGLVTVLFSLNSAIPVVGASGAIYGVLLAYGLAYPNREVYLYFMFPVKVKYVVGFLAIMAFWASFIQSGGSNISHISHLSGMVIGWIYLRSGWRSTWYRLGQRVANLQQERRIRNEFPESQEDEHLRRQVDRILDKISTEGFASLSEEEQELLYKASVRFSRRNTKD
ncbi:MAG: rhomboid family intramembrane serine protease [Fidelibacterota bacterium]|nr:MAG: rhomboid family intramembrane serine protease [Candidatus Neomarinimicrobiota bacterium]